MLRIKFNFKNSNLHLIMRQNKMTAEKWEELFNKFARDIMHLDSKRTIVVHD